MQEAWNKLGELFVRYAPVSEHTENIDEVIQICNGIETLLEGAEQTTEKSILLGQVTLIRTLAPTASADSVSLQKLDDAKSATPEAEKDSYWSNDKLTRIGVLASIGATAMSTDNYDEGYSILSCLLDELDSLTVAERIQAEKLLLNPGRKFDDYEIESSCGVACLLRALQLAQTERSSDEDIVRFLERSVEYLKSSQTNPARGQYYDLAKQALSQFSPAASYDATE